MIAIFYGFIWCAWKVRNERRFNDVRIPYSKLGYNVISMVFDWVKHRGRLGNCKWEDRCCNQFNIL